MKVTRDARAIWLVLFLLFATVLTGWMLGSLSKAEVKDGVSNTIDKNFLAESLPCTGPSEPANFRAFGLGDSFSGLKLVAALRRCDLPYPGEPVSANYVSYIYGDCKLEEVEAGRDSCQPPLEIQSWPACQRSLSDYDSTMIEDTVKQLPDVRGAKTLSFGGGRVEFYTGDSTVVAFASDDRLLKGVDQSLGEQSYIESTRWLATEGASRNGEDAALSADRSAIGPAAVGAVEGSLRCS